MPRSDAAESAHSSSAMVPLPSATSAPFCRVGRDYRPAEDGGNPRCPFTGWEPKLHSQPPGAGERKAEDDIGQGWTALQRRRLDGEGRPGSGVRRAVERLHEVVGG